MAHRSVLLATLGALPLALTVWLAVGEPGSALAAASAAQESIESDVARLSSPKRSERVAAEQALLRGGTGVLDRLPAADSVADPAARSAIVRIRRQLELQQAEQETGATLVTLEGTATLGEMTERLSGGTDSERPGGPAARAGQPSQFAFTAGQAQQTVEMHVRQQPFWPVLDELIAQVDLWPDQINEFGQFTFRPRSAEDEAVRLGYAGAFRIAAGPVAWKPIAGDATRQLARVSFELRCEPKLRPLFVSYAARDAALATADGMRLAAFTPGAKFELPFGQDGHAVELGLDFLASAREPSLPLTLTTALTVTAAAGSETFACDVEGDFPQESTHGDVTVRFREATLNDDGTAEVELSVVYAQGGPAFESYRTWVYHNAAYLWCRRTGSDDFQAVRLDHEPGFSTVAQSDGGIVLRYRFEGIPADATDLEFVYQAPTKIIDIPVHVEIDGLTLRPQ